MNPDSEFYLCPTCFLASEEPQPCHSHNMIFYAGATAEQRKPPMNGNGRIRDRAPIWFLQAKANSRV